MKKLVFTATFLFVALLSFGQLPSPPQTYSTYVEIGKNLNCARVDIEVKWIFATQSYALYGIDPILNPKIGDGDFAYFSSTPDKVGTMYQTICYLKFYNANGDLTGGDGKVFSGYQPYILYTGWNPWIVVNGELPAERGTNP